MILWWSDEKRNISSDLFTFNVAFTTKVKKKDRKCQTLLRFFERLKFLLSCQANSILEYQKTYEMFCEKTFGKSII